MGMIGACARLQHIAWVAGGPGLVVSAPEQEPRRPARLSSVGGGRRADAFDLGGTGDRKPHQSEGWTGSYAAPETVREFALLERITAAVERQEAAVEGSRHPAEG
jgi:hypothetical protein